MIKKNIGTWTIYKNTDKYIVYKNIHELSNNSIIKIWKFGTSWVVSEGITFVKFNTKERAIKYAEQKMKKHPWGF